MTLLAAACNTTWWTSCLPGYLAYRQALRRPAEEQRRILRAYLRRNAGTVFGRKHRFAALRSPEEYQDAVPLAGYDDYAPYVERIAAAEPGVLTRSRVRVLEPTSGSTAAAKLIPYTDELSGEFARALAPWVFDLFRSDPRLLSTPAYWSITPVPRRQPRPQSAIAVGFEEDTAYLGGWLKGVIDATLAVPAEVRWLGDVETFRYVTALFLLRCRGLGLVSVWHPSFLTLLLGSVRAHWDRLLRDLERGALTPPGGIEAGVAVRLRRRLLPDPRRSAELRHLGPQPATGLWPNLRLVSCWADGHAALGLDSLRSELPGVRIQPKGLIATEAFVTLPWGDAHALAVRSHFFEFLNGRGEVRLAHELERGEVYSVVVTTGGGLYRYRLADRIEVTGFVEATPTLRFLGKEDQVSDRFGEKLHAGFVAGVLRRLLDGIPARFALLAPETSGGRTRYTLFLESDTSPPALEPALEQALGENPHYRYCVDLGQLDPARVRRVRCDGYAVYARRCVELGQRLGDVKPLPLSPLSGWSGVFGREEGRGESWTNHSPREGS